MGGMDCGRSDINSLLIRREDGDTALSSLHYRWETLSDQFASRIKSIATSLWSRALGASGKIMAKHTGPALTKHDTTPSDSLWS